MQRHDVWSAIRTDDKRGLLAHHVGVPGPWTFVLPSVVSIAIVWIAFAVTDDLAAQIALIAVGLVVSLGLYTAFLWRRRARLERED
jgi:hypothetical protein